MTERTSFFSFSRLLCAGLLLTGLAEPLVAIAEAQQRPAARTRPGAATPARQTPPPVRPAGWSSPRGMAALQTSLSEILASGPRSGTWGVMVVSLSRGDTLFAHRAGEMMQPASTLKMYTAAIALDRLGSDHTFRTTVLRDGPVENGVVRGNLYLRGDGDPSLSPRYFREERPMPALARLIASQGIRRVEGDVIADATAFEDRLVPEGWQTYYLGAAYAARVSGLSLHDNLVWVVVQPAATAAVVKLEPASSTARVESTVRVVAGSGGSIVASRRSDGVIQVRGTIGRNSGPLRYSLVVDNPPMFVGGALHEALREAGVEVTGQVRLGASPAGAEPVAAVQSPELSRIVAAMNRESINIYAELLFRNAGRTVGENVEGSATTARQALAEFYRDKLSADPEQVYAADGSGLSILNRVTARSMIQLLDYAHRAPWAPAFHASLPVAGESETLRSRMRGAPAQGNLHAKTGTTNTVASLGGYVTARNGELLAFAFVYNGGDRWNARAVMDSMGSTLAEFVRGD
jgi:serine-type D-Ala-D-Ala carboxypeptidase/endopeptidase (penicillin-binding protein 4)